MSAMRMPKMGDGMEEGTILQWLKKEGDNVVTEEPVAEVETDKANVEIPAEESGVLTKIVVKAGETVPVGAVIAYIGEITEDGAASKSQPKQTIVKAKPIGDRLVEGERVKASPLARRRAKEMGIDLVGITGSGPGGRIVERDVRAVQLQSVAAATTTHVTLAAPVAPSLQGTDTEVSRMRRAIARRTVQSKQTVPHFYLITVVEMDRAVQLLEELNEMEPNQKLTVNDLIVQSCALALAEFPDVNASFTPDDRIRRYEAINIGIAVGTENGLTIPVISDCGNKTLRQIADAAKELIRKARSGALKPEEFSGGTFSISNLGMFGIEEFSAIINPPESAILAVGAIVKEAVPDESDRISIKKRMRITLSCDHRVVDGVLGARFLNAIKRYLEKPAHLIL